MYLACRKHAIDSLIDDRGEDANGDKQSLNDHSPRSYEAESSFIISYCNLCRTKWLIMSPTLRCYYCDKGFLRNISENVDKFGCCGCGKVIECLSMIVESVRYKEEAFETWYQDFLNESSEGNSLLHMENVYDQLLKLVPFNSIRMISFALTLAEAFRTKDMMERSIRYAHTAIKCSLTYDLRVVSDIKEERQKLNELDHNMKQLIKNFSKICQNPERHSRLYNCVKDYNRLKDLFDQHLKIEMNEIQR